MAHTPSSRMPSCDTSPRPVLSVIQPTVVAAAGDPPPPLPPPPKRKPVHLRAHSCPPTYLASATSSALDPPPARRRPLSRRYTRSATLSHLSSRSPLQSHSIPSWSSTKSHNDENDDDDDPGTLFEELLSRTLERKLRERVDAARRVKGYGGLKPGRELWIWSAVNRCSRTRTRLATADDTTTMTTKSPALTKDARRLGGHARSLTAPGTLGDVNNSRRSLSSKGEVNDDDEDEDEDDDDEPLGKKLQEAIEKRERQIVRLQIERRATVVATQLSPPPKRAVDVRVRVRLPTSPEPAFLRPLGSTGPTPSAPPPSSPGPAASAASSSSTAFPRSQPTFFDENLMTLSPSSSSSTKRSKRLRKNPTTRPSLVVATTATTAFEREQGRPISVVVSASPRRPPPPSLSTRSLSLPALPPKVASTPSSPCDPHLFVVAPDPVSAIEPWGWELGGGVQARPPPPRPPFTRLGSTPPPRPPHRTTTTTTTLARSRSDTSSSSSSSAFAFVDPIFLAATTTTMTKTKKKIGPPGGPTAGFGMKRSRSAGCG